MIDKNKIAKTLIELRGDRSREEVSKAIGVSISALQMYENANRVPRDEIKLALARYYNVSIESIFFETQ